MHGTTCMHLTPLTVTDKQLQALQSDQQQPSSGPPGYNMLTHFKAAQSESSQTNVCKYIQNVNSGNTVQQLTCCVCIHQTAAPYHARHVGGQLHVLFVTATGIAMNMHVQS
jgi:hypothetical protein